MAAGPGRTIDEYCCRPTCLSCRGFRRSQDAKIWLTSMRSIVLALLCAAMFSGQQSKLDQAWKLAANGQRGDAIHLLQSLIVTEPRNTDARLLLGSLLMEEGDKQSSIAQLKTAVEQRPRSAVAQNALGEAYNKFG